MAVAVLTGPFPLRSASAQLPGTGGAASAGAAADVEPVAGSALAVAAAATAAQADALGMPLGALPAVAAHRSPSLALGELAARHGVVPTPSQTLAMTALDDLGEPLRHSLTRVVNAYLAVEQATAAAYAHVDPAVLQQAAEGLKTASLQTGDAGDGLRRAGIDLGPVLSARLVLLDAAAALEQAAAGVRDGSTETSSTAAVQATSTTTCGQPVASVPVVFAVDVTGSANCYSDDFRLVIDVGGKDTYRNNAGGNGEKRVFTWPYAAGSAALVDLGGHDDLYVSNRHYGVNGGGIVGSGFLYDDGGNDVYSASSGPGYNAGGTNGGSELGAGFLYDAWGDDRYTAARYASNGGTSSGAALVVDGAGHDTYDATNTSGIFGANNGSAAGGASALVDLGDGTDTYRSTGSFSNGGGIVGLLLDAGGNGDTYTDDSTTTTDQSQVPKGAGAQVDDCRTGVEAGADDRLAALCSVVLGAVPSVSVDDASVAEGGAGVTEVTFTVSLSHPLKAPAVVDYTTADGTASAASDYRPSSGTVVFSASETTKTVTVAVNGDTVIEDHETFFVVLSRAAGAVVVDGSGRGIIVDDDGSGTSPPFTGKLRVADAPPVAEGTPGVAGHTQGFARFVVSLSSPATSDVSVSYATVNGSATGSATGATPADYTTTSGTLVFAPGELSKVVSVPITMDSSSSEVDEDLFLNLSSPTGAPLSDSQARAVIYNDDPTSTATVSVNDVQVRETGTTSQAIFTVSVSKPVAAPFSVRAFTADGTAHPAPHESKDYVQLNQTINFAANEMSKQVAVTINGDNVAERDEFFYLALEDSTGPMRDKRQGVGTIFDDDNFPTVSIDDVVLTEGNSGTTEARFTVALSHSSFRDITVGYATTDGTARGTNHGVFGPADYTPATGTLRFAPGETTKSVVVVVNGDVLREQDEEFFVHLPSAVNAVQAKRVGVGTIRNDD